MRKISEKKNSYSDNHTIKSLVLKELEKVIDPELGIDIVNLGLVYDIHLKKEGDIQIVITLTNMGCPLIDYFKKKIHDVVIAIPEINNLEVEIVWSPAWTIDKMSRYARIALGVK